MRKTLLLILLLQTVLAQGAPSQLRSRIRFPQDCAFLAHEGTRKTPADRCAESIQALDEAIKKTLLAKKCENLPPLNSFVSGETPQAEQIEFLPLAPGKFILRITCSLGAYNRQSLFFIYDDELASSTQGAPISPKLILFPTDPLFQSNVTMRRWGLKPFEVTTHARHFDPKTQTLFAFAKGTGDGSTGYYTQYQFNKKDFLPRLILTIVKDIEDYKAPYQFQPEKKPNGKGWLSQKPKKEISGCFTKLDELSCQ